MYWIELENNTIEFPETFYCLEKPVNPTELKLTIEMASYRHQMENALYKSERKYKLLVENADDPIIIVNYDGTFLLVNQSGAKYFGGVPEDFKDKNMWDVFPKQHADSQIRSVRQVIDSGKGIVKDEKTRINNTEIWFSSKIQPITDSNGSISAVQIISRDIPEEKR